MNVKVLIIGAVGFAVVLGVVAYYTFAYTSPALVVRLITTNPPVAGGIIDPTNEKRHFDPGEGPNNPERSPIRVKVNTTVEIVFVNNDDIETHQLCFVEFNVCSKPIQPFETDIIIFKPDKVGTFSYRDPRPVETYTYTDYRGVKVNQVVRHSDEIGTLIVEP